MSIGRLTGGWKAWIATTAFCAVLAAPASATTYTVSTTADSGAGSLAQAITDANNHTGADDIAFTLGGDIIALSNALPAITEAVSINDGTAGDIVDGSGVTGLSTDGFTITASNVMIQGLAIESFTGYGVVIGGSNNTIAKNTITGNSGGISITSGSGNVVGGSAGGNTIGGFSGGNFGDGVTISGSASNNTIGGVANGEGNEINSNDTAGVALTGTGTGNTVRGNAIASNGGLGIDLGTTGVDTNDTQDPDSGANGLQNYPVLTGVTTPDTTSTVTGSLNSTPSTTFRIDFYGVPQCDDSGNGEGDNYLGSTTVSTNGSGDATINASLPAITYHFVTATATSGSSGNGNTSEFSACQVGPPTGAIVTNGTVELGVNNTGDLNYSCEMVELNCPGPSAGGADPVGLRYKPSNLDSTSPGCPCEGWGMADAGSGLTGYANESSGTANVTVNSFTHNATDAVSNVTISDPSVPNRSMTVVQNYHPSTVSQNLYEVTVTVTNTGTNGFTDLRYRRAMDWDIEPTPFNEYSTIQGTSPQLLFDSDNGFADSNPLTDAGDLGSTGQFTDSGPADHGAVFDFGFGALAAGASKTFKVYYGAAPDETTALSALSTGGAQVYSLGESSCPEDGNDVAGCSGLPADAGKLQGKPATFMFGFVTTTGDLSITKTDSPDPVIVNHDLTYTLTITNNGPEAAAGVHIEDPLPAGVTFKSVTADTGGTCANASGTVKCDFPSIANNGSKTVTIVVTPTATTSDLSNTATVSSASADANSSNNSSTSHTQVVEDQPQISINDPAAILEGDSGTKTLTFTISLDRAAPSDVTVHYATADGTATQPADYAPTSGTATITTGNTSTTVDVTINGDTVDEDNETLKVNLTTPSGGIIVDNQGVGTITDDDGPAISVNDVTVIEGNSGTTPATFTVSLAAPSPQTVTVNYATSDDSATQPSDYTAASGTLTFNPGQTSKQVTVNVNGDTTVEPDEAFHLNLSSPSNATIADNLGIGTITNDDVVAPPAAPTLAISDSTVNPEGNSGTKNADFTVTLSSASLSAVTVNFTTSNNSATQPGDYAAGSGTLTFSPGETSKTISVPVVGDTVPEPTETFNVDLSAPSGATLGDGHGVGTIIDDDQIGGGGGVGSGDLFCGAQHRGKCKGLTIKDEFDRPGNASWVFAAYNPNPGNSGKGRAHAAAAKPIVLGTVRKKVAKGKVTFVFKMKPGAKTNKLYKRVKKAKFKGVLITRTFTPADGGPAEKVTKSVKLKK